MNVSSSYRIMYCYHSLSLKLCKQNFDILCNKITGKYLADEKVVNCLPYRNCKKTAANFPFE